jgi:hypothetical protein
LIKFVPVALVLGIWYFFSSLLVMGQNAAQPAVAPPQLEAFSICFVSDLGMQIADIDPNTRTLVRSKKVKAILLGGGEHPQWSASHDKVAYEDHGAFGGIFIKDLNDPGFAQPVNVGAQPVWSTNGDRLCFVDNNELKVTNFDGSGMRVLGQVAGRSMASWDPDNKHILYTDNQGELVVVDSSSGRTAPQIVGEDVLPENCSAISLDGKRMAYAVHYQPAKDGKFFEALMVHDFETHSTSFLLKRPAVDLKDSTLDCVLWSPRGDEIALVQTIQVANDPFATRSQLYIVNFENKTIDSLGGFEVAREDGKGNKPVQITGLAWSPLGHNLVVSTLEPLILPAGAIKGVDQPTLCYPNPEFDAKANNRIWIFDRHSLNSGPLIFRSGHDVSVRGGTSWQYWWTEQ